MGNSESLLIQSLINYLLKNKDIPSHCKNFTNVMKLLRVAEINEADRNTQSPLDLLFAKLEAENPNSLAVRQYKTFKIGAEKTLRSILISCGVRLSIFNMYDIENLTNDDTMELEKIHDKKMAIFIITNKEGTFNLLKEILLMQIEQIKNKNININKSGYDITNLDSQMILKTRLKEKQTEQIVRKSEVIDQVFKENNVTTVRDAVNRIMLKKGEVIVNEQINKDTGSVEYHYNII